MFPFEFTDREDIEKVLEIGCFHIASQLFIVRPWQLLVEAELKKMNLFRYRLFSKDSIWNYGMKRVLVW